MINQKLGKMFNIADFRECGDITFETSFHDSHWRVSVICVHGTCTDVSESPADLETAFAKVLNKFQVEHEEKKVEADLPVD